MNVVEFNTKQELYDYLNNFDFDSLRDTKLSSVYFLVEFDDHTEPIYFTRFEDVWFPSPCVLYKYPLENDDEMGDFIKEFYCAEYWNDAREYLKSQQRDGWHYEIECFQCAPFLPNKIKILDAFSDSKCLDWLLSREKTEGMNV